MAQSCRPTIRIHSIHSTPLRSKELQSVPGNAWVEQARDAICLDLNETVGVVPTDDFRNYLLPDLHSGIDLDLVLQELRKRQTITDDHWSLFSVDPRDMVKPSDPLTLGPDGKPRTEPMNEDAVFKNFEELAKYIQDACASISGLSSSDRLCEFRCNPASIPRFEIRNSLLSRPDSYAVRCTSKAIKAQKARVNWVDVVAPGEFKKREDDDDKLDNRRKILWSLYHIMREDVRRRFVFGYTIENRMMRWWYCSWSEVLASTPFDFIANHDMVVDFVLSMTFANEVQLGWDPTIKLLRRSRLMALPRYEILVRDISSGQVVERTFRTKDLLWNHGADAFRGRGTRVWSVVEVDERGLEGTDLLALKEGWADVDREREGKLFHDIKHRVDMCCEDFLKEAFNELFMQPRAFGDVWIESRADRTDDFKTGRDGRKLAIISTLDITVGMPNFDAVHPQEAKLPRRRMPEARSVRSTAMTQAAAPEYSPKVHQRTVFKNAGKELLTLHTLAAVFEMISEVFRGLYILHLVNWVHRDISYGNVLVHKSAKISDLEYAKELSDDSTHHGIRTGTPYFMAEEVRVGQYLFKPKEVREKQAAAPTADWFLSRKLKHASIDEVDAGKPTTSANANVAPTTTLNPTTESNRKISFRHNPLHDMESLLWLSMFVLLISDYENNQRDGNGKLIYDSKVFEGFLKAQQELASLLFNDLLSRHIFITQDGFLSDKTAGLHPTVRKVLLELDEMRKSLVSLYVEAEKGIKSKGHEEIDMDWAEADKQLDTHVQNILKILEDNPLPFVKDVSRRNIRPRAPKPPAATKRAAVDEIDADDKDGQAQGQDGITSDEDPSRRHAKRIKTQKESDVSSSRPQKKLPSLVSYMAVQEGSRDAT